MFNDQLVSLEEGLRQQLQQQGNHEQREQSLFQANSDSTIYKAK